MKALLVDGQFIGGYVTIRTKTTQQIAREIEQLRYFERHGLSSKRANNIYGTSIYIPRWTAQGARQRVSAAYKLGRGIRKALPWKTA